MSSAEIVITTPSDEVTPSDEPQPIVTECVDREVGASTTAEPELSTTYNREAAIARFSKKIVEQNSILRVS